MNPVRVGILDTGVAGVAVAASAAFLSDDSSPGEASDFPAAQAGEHGARLALIVTTLAPDCVVLDARAFVHGRPGSAARIARAIDWLVAQDAAIINMSFGLRDDRNVLARAVERAVEAGVVCVASQPASGDPVFPASYPGVVGVTSDARCSAGQFSLLQVEPDIRFGAAAGGPHHHAHQRGGGASFACAHLTAGLARQLQDQTSPAQAIRQLIASCSWQGRECRR